MRIVASPDAAYANQRGSEYISKYMEPDPVVRLRDRMYLINCDTRSVITSVAFLWSLVLSR